MKHLNENWIFEGWLDVEYKKYVLLDYLQHSSSHFKRNRLYPYLAELVARHRELLQLRKDQKSIETQFPRRLQGIDWENKQLKYVSPLPPPDNDMQLLQEIMEMGLELLQGGIEEGRERYDSIAEELELQPIGLMPLETSAGYLLITTQRQPEVLCYQFETGLFENAHEKYRALQTTYLYTTQRSISQPLEKIKFQLIQNRKDLPNPATFAAIYKHWIPVQATLLPIVKRLLIRTIKAG